MPTVARTLAVVARATDDRTLEEVVSTPRFITLTEVREVLDIRLISVRGGFNG